MATVKIEFFIFSFSPREKHDFLRLNESNHSSLNFDHNNFLRGLIFSLSQTESRLLSLSFLKYLDSKGDVNSSFLPSSKKSSPAWFTYLRSTQIFFFRIHPFLSFRKVSFYRLIIILEIFWKSCNFLWKTLLGLTSKRFFFLLTHDAWCNFPKLLGNFYSQV